MELTFEPKELFMKLKMVITKPTQFYKAVEKEKGWKDAFTFSIVISLIASFLGLLEVTLLYPLFKDTLPGVFTPENRPQLLELLPAFFVSALIVIALGFIWAGALHLWLRVWRIKGDYWSAYKAFTYSRAPNALFSWLPYIGIFFALYSMYVLSVGISVHYHVSMKKSLILTIVPVILLYVLQALIVSVFSSQLV